MWSWAKLGRENLLGIASEGQIGSLPQISVLG